MVEKRGGLEIEEVRRFNSQEKLVISNHDY